MAHGFRRTRGGVEVRFERVEAELLQQLAREVLATLDADPDHPALARVLPSASQDDPVLAAEMRELMGDELRATKRERLVLLAAEAAAGVVVLDEDGSERWLTALNDLRLALGTVLDVTEEEPPEVDDAYAVYQWLGYLLESLLEAVAD